MSKVLDEIYAKAKKLGKTIVLPEGEDKRVVEAACEVVKQGKQRKIKVFHYNAKKNFHKTQGHRQPYTKVVIKSIK